MKKYHRILFPKVVMIKIALVGPKSIIFLASEKSAMYMIGVNCLCSLWFLLHVLIGNKCMLGHTSYVMPSIIHVGLVPHYLSFFVLMPLSWADRVYLADANISLTSDIFCLLFNLIKSLSNRLFILLRVWINAKYMSYKIW